MSNQDFENNGLNGTRPLGEGSSPSRCFLVQHREPSRHQVTARIKWYQEVDEFQCEFGEDAAAEVETVENEDMVENEVESFAEEIVNVEEVNNNVIYSLDDPRHNLNHERRKVVERLNEIMLEGKKGDGIMCKKVDKKTLKVQTDRVNDAIKYFKSKNFTEKNYLIKAASVWVAEQIGLKERDYRKKNEPRWKRRNEGDKKKLRQDVNLLTRV